MSFPLLNLAGQLIAGELVVDPVHQPVLGDEDPVADEHGGEVFAVGQLVTVAEWLRTWFELYSKPNLRETTQEQYTNFLEKHLIPNIGDIPLEKLTSLRLQKLYQDLVPAALPFSDRWSVPGRTSEGRSALPPPGDSCQSARAG